MNKIQGEIAILNSPNPPKEESLLETWRNSEKSPPKKYTLRAFQEFNKFSGVDIFAFENDSLPKGDNLKEQCADLTQRMAKQIGQSQRKKNRHASPIEELGKFISTTDRIHTEICLEMALENVAKLLPKNGEKLQRILKPNCKEIAILLCATGLDFPHPYPRGIKDLPIYQSIINDPGTKSLDNYLSNPAKTLREDILEKIPDEKTRDLYDAISLVRELGKKLEKSIENILHMLAKTIGILFGEKTGEKCQKIFQEELSTFKNFITSIPEQAGKKTAGALALTINLDLFTKSNSLVEIALLGTVACAASPFIKEALSWQKSQKKKRSVLPKNTLSPNRDLIPAMGN